ESPKIESRTVKLTVTAVNTNSPDIQSIARGIFSARLTDTRISCVSTWTQESRYITKLVILRLTLHQFLKDEILPKSAIKDPKLPFDNADSLRDEEAEGNIAELFEHLNRIELRLPEDTKDLIALYTAAQHRLQAIQSGIHRLETELSRIFQRIPDLKQLSKLVYLQASGRMTDKQELQEHHLWSGLLPAQKQFWKRVETLSAQIGNKRNFLSRWTDHVGLLELEASNRGIKLPEGPSLPKTMATQPSVATQPEAPAVKTPFNPRLYGGKELCIVVSYFKAGKHK